MHVFALFINQLPFFWGIFNDVRNKYVKCTVLINAVLYQSKLCLMQFISALCIIANNRIIQYIVIFTDTMYACNYWYRRANRTQPTQICPQGSRYPKPLHSM